MAGGRGQILATERQPARPRREVPGHELHQGRLADPVPAGDEGELARSDGGREAVDDRDVAVAAGERVDRQHRSRSARVHPLPPPA